MSQIPIPSCEFETQQWQVSSPELYSRTRVRKQTGSYKSSVVPAISDWQPQFSGEVSGELSDAERMLSSFDTYASKNLSTPPAEIAPMSAILLRTESASSSQIENLTASAKQLALASIDESRSTNALTVMGNVRAMEAALRLADNISQDTILTMHSELMRGQDGNDEIAGAYRSVLVWVGGDAAGPIGAQHVAPQANRIPAAMNDLVAFANRDDLPILAQVAVAHAQFETIHPFVDGNGRTGRALAHALLRNKNLVAGSTVPLSAGILRDTKRYFDALTKFRSGDALPIINVFTDASRFAAASGKELVDGLEDQLRLAREQLAEVRSHSQAWGVVPHLVANPIVNARLLKRKLGFNDAVANNALATLTEHGVLKETTGNKRNRVWQHDGILKVLDDYANSIRRA